MRSGLSECTFRPGPGQARILIPEPFQPEQPSQRRAADLQRLNPDNNTHTHTCLPYILCMQVILHAGVRRHSSLAHRYPFPAFQAEHALKAGGELKQKFQRGGKAPLLGGRWSPSVTAMLRATRPSGKIQPVLLAYMWLQSTWSEPPAAAVTEHAA